MIPLSELDIVVRKAFFPSGIDLLNYKDYLDIIHLSEAERVKVSVGRYIEFDNRFMLSIETDDPWFLRWYVKRGIYFELIKNNQLDEFT